MEAEAQDVIQQEILQEKAEALGSTGISLQEILEGLFHWLAGLLPLPA